jgi:hypothetical protein
MRKYFPCLVLGVALVFPLWAASAADNKSKWEEVSYPPCEGNPSKAEQEAAKGLYMAGKTSYDEGNYPEAINLWQGAFKRDCTAPLLLYNLANAYEKQGDRYLKGAVVSLETYLSRQPNSPNRGTIEKRIENLKQRIHDIEKANTVSKVPTSSSSSPPPPGSSDGGGPPPPPPSKGPGIAPWLVVGAGGALVLTGTIFYIIGAGNVSDAETQCSNRSSCPQSIADKGNSGRSQETVGGIMLGVGLAAVGGGLAWFFLTKGKEPAPKTTSSMIFPTFGPGFAGLSAQGHF